MRRFQSVYYQAEQGGEWKYGVAALGSSFDSADVRFITDAESGCFVERAWDYKLESGPLCYLQVGQE